MWPLPGRCACQHRLNSASLLDWPNLFSLRGLCFVVPRQPPPPPSHWLFSFLMCLVHFPYLYSWHKNSRYFEQIYLLQKSVLYVLTALRINLSESFANPVFIKLTFFNLSCSGDFSPPICFHGCFLPGFHYGSPVLWTQGRGQLRALKRIVILDWHQHMMAFLLLPLLWSAPVTLAHGQAVQARRGKKKKKRGCQL